MEQTAMQLTAAEAAMIEARHAVSGFTVTVKSMESLDKAALIEALINIPKKQD